MHIVNWKAFLLPYEQTVDSLSMKFNHIIDEYVAMGQPSPIRAVTGRVKSVASILAKAGRKSIPYEKIKDDIEDIAGIRIQCAYVEDIETVIEIIRRHDGLDLKILRERNYISNTKPSGYRSYHILGRYYLVAAAGAQEVNFEIQIRTLAMDFWATSEHYLRYKYNGNIPVELQKRLKTAAEAAFRLDQEMSLIREEILEVEKTQIKTENLVEEILTYIQNLFFTAGPEQANRMNQEFVALYQAGDPQKLSEFSRRLAVMTDLYRDERSR